MLRTRRSRLLTATIALGLVAAACGGDDDDAADTTDPATSEAPTTEAPSTEAPTTEAPTTEAPSTETLTSAAPDGSAPAGELDTELASVCPEVVPVQTDWHPESEHGMLYHLVGDDYEIDTDQKATRGSLTIGGVDTGIDIEVRAGGPAIGFEPVPSQMYADTSIVFGYAGTDGQFLIHETPVLSVVAPVEIWPQIIYWDADVLPDVETIADLGEEGVTINVFAGGVYPEVLAAQGIVSADQFDPSYDGTPARFIAAAQAGEPLAQQGYASSEPYAYEHVFEEYGKPLKWQLIHDTGFQPYTATLGIRPDELEELTPCLEKIVPIFQQATVDYFADPAATNELIIEVIEAYDSGWEYTIDQAEWAAQAQVEFGIVGNGHDDIAGNIEPARIEEVFAQLQEAGLDTGDLTPDDIYTNEFIDESISF